MVYFSQTIGFDISCKLAPKKSNEMSKPMFLEKYIISLSSADLTHRVVKIKYLLIRLSAAEFYL